MELLNILLLDIKPFGMKVWDNDLLELVIRFILNTSVALIIVRGLYYPLTKRKDYLFTYLLFSVVIFFLCNLLSNSKISTGFALGLFAVFSIMRYRTDAIPIKEMTYLFLVIGISVVNALVSKKVSWGELIFTNVAIIGITYFLEKLWLTKHEYSQQITYEKIDLIKPENHANLLEDLKARTGLDIIRFEIGRIDFLRDTAQIKIFFNQEED